MVNDAMLDGDDRRLPLRMRSHDEIVPEFLPYCSRTEPVECWHSQSQHTLDANNEWTGPCGDCACPGWTTRPGKRCHRCDRALVSVIAGPDECDGMCGGRIAPPLQVRLPQCTCGHNESIHDHGDGPLLMCAACGCTGFVRRP